jgi:EAL domain-containing protein (putative c-di-GMP-specific phosphodiesterase class I)
VLKVDRSFVDGLGTEPEDSAVVAAILSLAHALGLHQIGFAKEATR